LAIFIGMASGMKRGIKLEILTVIGMAAGAVAFRILLVQASHLPIAFGLRSLVDPYLWLAIVISTACAVSKIRYL